MRKKLLRFLCTALMAVVCMSVNAQATSGSCGANATWEYDNGTLTISGTGAMDDYTDDPSSTPWAAYRTSVTKVVIGDDITSVGNCAFNLFTALTDVTIGESVETIGIFAFDNCIAEGFTTLNIPNSVTTIKSCAFSNNHLKYVRLGSGLTEIWQEAFMECRYLKYISCCAATPPTIANANVFTAVTPTAIYVPTASVATYQAADKWDAFSGVITEQHNCGDGDDGNDPTDAVFWAFDETNYSLAIVGKGAIKTYSTDMPTAYPWWIHNSDLQGIIISEGITNIPDWAFAMYENARYIYLPSTMKSIGNTALEEGAFENIYLPEGLETIGHYAFSDNPLVSICIPSTVTSIGQAAFSYCADLVAVGCYASTPPALYDNTIFDESPNIANVYVPSAKVQNYKEADYWSAFGDKIKSPSGDCGTSATWSYEMATRTLTIEGTGAIEDYSGWDGTMGGAVGSFNPNNIKGYPCGIENVIIGEGITEIPDGAFYMEVGIKNLTLPSTLTAIGTDAFGECEGIEVITCDAVTPPTLGTDGSGVFYENDAEYNQVKIAALTAINVPAASVAAYKAADGWRTYAALIVAGGEAPATTTTFTYTASEKLTIFDDESNFTGATGVKSHEFAAGTGTVVYDGTVTAIADYTFRYDNDAKEKLTGITIPESVTNTGEYTFWMCKNLATVTFDGTPALTTIGKSAFKGCEALTTIAIPASVEEIGVSAFSDCTKLANVTFSGTSSLTTIHQSAFSGCTSLTSITLPESLTTLGTIQDLGGGDVYYNGSVFYGSGITSLNIPKNVTNIYGAGYFGECNMTSLTVDAENAKYADLGSNAIFEKTANKLVVGCNASSVPAGVTTIGYESFWAISDPFTLTLPASVTTIEARAFHLANGLMAINIPSGVTEIGEGTFAGCSITTLALPDALTTIGREAFNGCPELTTLTLGSELTTIGEGAFSGCDKLTSLNIPAKVTTLENAFSSGNLASITVEAGNTKYDSRGNCNAIIDSETNTLLLGCKNTTFPADVATIGNGAFSGCKGLTTFVIPSTISSIGSSAFSFCSNLTDISIPNSVTSIESSTFQSCKSLKSLVIHNDMTSIGSSAFSGCSGLTTVILGSGLTSIGQRAFYDCTAVTDVYCYADPEELTWSSAGLYFGYDFKDGKATLCHVADASAWPCTESSDKFYKVNVTFVGDLAPAVAGNAVDGVYWATYYNSAANMKADANTTVYKAAINGSSIVLTEIDDKVITAGQAVILKSTGASIAMTTSAAASADDYSGNVLEGVDAATAVDANYKYYVLSNEGSTLGFYKFAGSTLGANKAFYKTNATGAPEFFAFGETTGMNDVRSKMADVRGEFYNLAGQRVTQPTKGLYIVNGKKVIIK